MVSCAEYCTDRSLWLRECTAPRLPAVWLAPGPSLHSDWQPRNQVVHCLLTCEALVVLRARTSCLANANCVKHYPCSLQADPVCGCATLSYVRNLCSRWAGGPAVCWLCPGA